MDNIKDSILAAFAALAIYSAIVVTFLFYMVSSEVKNIDAFNKTTVLELDIVIDKPKETSEEKISIKQSNESDSSSEVVKKSSSSSIKQRSNLKSLFANVDTESSKISKGDVLNIKESSIASRFKSKFEKDKKVESLSVSNLSEDEKNNIKKNVIQNSENEKDPYYSKIYQIISSRWKPVIFYNDLSAKVIITISNYGDFSYRFIQYSDNIGFDNQLRNFLDNESFKKYPVNPNGKESNIEILFKSKGES